MTKTLADMMRTSTRQSPYFGKDLAKAARATQFVGQGSPASSTAAYAVAMGPKANTGAYGPDVVVFVSVEGMRRGRFAAVANGKPQGAYANVVLAAEAGARFVMDRKADRDRSYNVGEREVAALIESLGYREVETGLFAKGE